MRSASLVSLLNFMWGVGAMTCPLLIAFALRHNRISLTLLGCAAFGVVMVIGLLFTSFGADEKPHEANIAEASGAGPALHVTLALASLFLSMWRWKTALEFGRLNFPDVSRMASRA